MNEGEPVRLVCEVRGNGALYVRWTWSGGRRLPLGVRENGTDLVIAAANSSHPGIYVCSARNVGGISAADEANVTVCRKSYIMQVFYWVVK